MGIDKEQVLLLGVVLVCVYCSLQEMLVAVFCFDSSGFFIAWTPQGWEAVSHVEDEGDSQKSWYAQTRNCSVTPEHEN